MATAKPKAYALDIFKVLDRINARDFGAFRDFSEPEKKSFQPYIAMKWMLGTTDKQQILRLNARVNPYMFSLGNHKELLYMLLCASTNGKARRYSWVKPASNTGKFAVTLGVIEEHYKYSAKQAIQALPLFSKEEILDIAQYLGRQSEELTKIKNEFKSSAKTTV